MVWEGDPLPATVAKLEELGLGSVVFDPCGNRPREGDFLGVMRGNIERLESVFE
jgi:zinc transport system substrate-binding protein